MMGQPAPTRSLAKTIAGAVVYIKDPGEISYDTIRGKAFDFIRRETGSSVAGRTGGKSAALYNYRVAKRRGDETSVRLAMDELRKYPKAGRSLRQSMKRAAPLGMFPSKKLRGKFLRTLSPRERDQLSRATRWYNG